jgi:hypothetical protein
MATTSLTGFYSDPATKAMSEPAPRLSTDDQLQTARQKLTEAGTSKGLLQRAEAGEKAEQGKMLTEADVGTREAFRQAVETDPFRAEYREKVKEQADTKFVPTQETAGDLGLLFTLTNILGFAIGGKSKGNAQAAMSAMNGMLEGHQKGRQDIYKQEKDKFDENFKALDKTIQSLKTQYEDAMKTYANNREEGMAKARMAVAEHNARFIQDSLEKFGPAYAYDQIRDTVSMLEKAKSAEQKLQDAEERRAETARRDAETARSHQATEELRSQGMEQSRQLAEERMAGKKERVTQQQFVSQRAVNALGGVASAVETLSQLPAGTNVGILPNLQTKDGMTNYLRNAAGRTMTSSESKAVDTLFTGITRNLASIEASGSATGLTGLSGQLEKLKPVAGDKAVDVALKMADIRRIATENIVPLVDSGLMPAGQAKVAKDLLGRIEKAIPYTTDDIAKALNPKGRATIGQAAQTVAKPVRSFATEAEAEAAFKAGTLKSGDKVTIGGQSGTWE